MRQRIAILRRRFSYFPRTFELDGERREVESILRVHLDQPDVQRFEAIVAGQKQVIERRFDEWFLVSDESPVVENV